MTQRETFSYEGALWLKNKIEKFWSDRGGVVNCRLEPIVSKYTDEQSGRNGTIKGYVVRSDMVGGYPIAKMMKLAA